jgi:hypothetical protein
MEEWQKLFTVIGFTSEFALFGRMKLQLLWSVFASVETAVNIQLIIKQKNGLLEQFPQNLKSIKEVSINFVFKYFISISFSGF